MQTVKFAQVQFGEHFIYTRKDGVRVKCMRIFGDSSHTFNAVTLDGMYLWKFNQEMVEVERKERVIRVIPCPPEVMAELAPIRR